MDRAMMLPHRSPARAPPPRERVRRRAVLAVALLIVSVLLPGCLGFIGGGSGGGGGSTFRAESPAAAGSTDDEGATGWQVGAWWSYAATFKGNRTYHVTLVAYDESPDQFVLGSNRSSGFFGLPFNGNVTRGDLNPVIAGKEWPLYRFPLEDGKSWSYDFMGHKLTTRVTAATVDLPGVGKHQGFRLEATAFGMPVVSYTYSPVVEWFTHMVIRDPSEDREVMRVALMDHGGSYERAFFVNVPVHEYETQYPALPGEDAFDVDGEFLEITGTVLLTGRVGDFRFAVEDPDGREVMAGAVRPQGTLMDRRSMDSVPGTWTIRDRGLGDGELFVEVTGLRAVRGGEHLPAGALTASERAALDEAWPLVDLPGLLAAAAPTPPAAEPSPALPDLTG